MNIEKRQWRPEMSLIPGGSSKTYLDPNFFAKETKRCGLTPDMSKQFELIVQGLVGQFQHDVEAASEGFATFLQQSSDSPKDLMKALNRTKGDLQNLTQNFLGQMKTLLVQSAPDHPEAIETFIQDVQTQIAPFTDIESRVRSQPALQAKLGARSIFDLSSSAIKPPIKPVAGEGGVQGAIDRMTKNWEARFPVGSAQRNVAEAIKQLIEQLKNKIPPASLQEIIAAIDKQIYNSNQKQDIYMRFPGITQDQLRDLAQQLSDGKTTLNVPTFTRMDQKFQEALNWMNNPNLSAGDKELARQLVSEIRMLGSGNDQQAALQAWASNTTIESDYAKASSDGINRFASITGISAPLPRPSPPEGPTPSKGEGGGFANFIKQMQHEQLMRMAIEFSLENLIGMMAQEAKVSAMPPFVQKIVNKIMDTTHIHIGGDHPYSPNQTVPPGEPLPTNSWWTLLADDRGAGNLNLQVVADNQPITHPRQQIRLSDAKLFDPNAAVGQQVTVPYNMGNGPNVNQGVYNVQSYNSGFAFNPSEKFLSGPSDYRQANAYYMVAGAKEELIFPPTVVAHDDNSVTLEYKTKTGGSMSVPITRGSPYQTFQYQNSTPYFNSTSTPIDVNSIHAYFYKKVVEKVTDSKTQISVQDAKALGLNTAPGSVDLVENNAGPPWKNGIEGQVFSYKTASAGIVPGDTYRLYFSGPVTLNLCNYVTETVIPDDVPLPPPDDNPNHYIHDATKKPYSTVQYNQYSDSQTATGLQVSGPFSGTARIAKIPTSCASASGGSSLIDDTLKEIYGLLDQGKGMADLINWASGLLSNTNFLQDYPNMTAEDFYQFCRLAGISQSDAESRLAQLWIDRVPMDPNNPKIPYPKKEYQQWFEIASKLQSLIHSPAQLQQWLQNVVNGKDPTYSPIYNALNPSNQTFVKVFSQFGVSPYQPETSIDQAYKDAQTVNQNAARTPDLYQQTSDLFDKDAWNIPVSGHYESVGLGKWRYTYTTDPNVNPYAHLGLKAPTDGSVLIGLLKTDFSYLDGSKVFSDQAYYETLKGEVEFAETKDNQINFYDKDTKLSWPDDDLSKLSAKDQEDLVNKYINDVVPNLMLPDRSMNQATYFVGKNTQNAADVAHALWKLAQLNPSLNQNPKFQAALKNATGIAEAGLDDFLTGGLLEYDQTNGMLVSKFGQQGGAGSFNDYANAYGEDHHFAYGYLIRAAAELRQVDPSWFKDPQWGTQRTQMVNLMVNDVFNVQNNPNFPRMRMWDPYIGVGRATGLVPPAVSGMNEESTAEDYNCIQGIALWAETDGNSDLANQAATMAERVKHAAQAYWQPSSSTSIYTDKYAPEAAREFAKNVISCGVNWDTDSTAGNYFTPKNGDSNIFTIAIEYITGNGSFVDYDAAKRAFDYLINQSNAGFPRIFQSNIPYNTVGATAYFPFITTLIPLIAKVSPNAAKAILEWYQQANARQPNAYAYDDGCNYGTIYQQILMAQATNTHPDPYSSTQDFQSKLPPLPPQASNPVLPPDIVRGDVQYFLLPWTKTSPYYDIVRKMDEKYKEGLTREQVDAWLQKNVISKNPDLQVPIIDSIYFGVYKQFSTNGLKLMQALLKGIDELKAKNQYTVQAIREWIQNSLLPTFGKQFPNLNDFDVEAFCKASQFDIRGV